MGSVRAMQGLLAASEKAPDAGNILFYTTLKECQFERGVVFRFNPGHVSDGDLQFFHQHDKIAVIDFLDSVSQFEELHINDIKFIFVGSVPQKFKSVLDGMAAASGGKDNVRFIDTYLLRSHDLIIFRMFQETILVDT